MDGHSIAVCGLDTQLDISNEVKFPQIRKTFSSLFFFY